jgi:IclR family transcriptional regulator, acetate operon repressor
VEQEFQVSNGGPAAHGTTAVDRGADLLVRVLESEQPVALTDLASAAGLPKSTASRLVSALERRGLIEQDGERGRLRPGPAILRVAERSMLERNIVEVSRPALDALAEASGETINLAVPGPEGVEHIAQVDSRHFLGAGQWLGRSVGYEHSANGKVFAAFGRAAFGRGPAGAVAARAELELQRVLISEAGTLSRRLGHREQGERAA